MYVFEDRAFARSFILLNELQRPESKGKKGEQKACVKKHWYTFALKGAKFGVQLIKANYVNFGIIFLLTSYLKSY